jgi:Ca-activated chloride channel family protein
MKTITMAVCMLLFGGFAATTMVTGKLVGKVTEAETLKPLASAYIYVMQGSKIVTQVRPQPNGEFVLELSEGAYSVRVSSVGFTDRYFSVYISAGKSTPLNVVLEKDKSEPKATQLILADCEVMEESIVTGYAVKSEHRSKLAGAPISMSANVYCDDVYYIDHNTEGYDVVNENRFKDVLNNPLSTFSVDVDRASYANVRRFLNQNQKPVKDAVRIEELINYFDYDYPQPRNGHPFSVTVEADACPWNAQRQLVLIGLKGENLNEEQIPPSNLVFLIDVSGSMESPNKLHLLKQAFSYLVKNLRPQDRVAIVVYAGAAGVVLESTEGTNKPKIQAALELLQAGGSTAGGAGIKLAYKIAKDNYIHGGNNRVILATDGDFNVGASSDAEMVRLIEEKRKDGVFLSILGFGMGNYKDSKMEKLSNAGNGNYAYIDNILEAKKVFGTELWGTLYTIAKDVKIQVEFNPARVKAYRLIGYENRMLNKEDFNDDKKDAGDIGCGHTVSALYEIILVDSNEKVSDVDPLEYQKAQEIDSKNLMTVKLRYKQPNEDVSKLLVERVEASKLKATRNIKFASAVAEFGMLLRDSEHKGNATYASVISRARSNMGADEHGYKSDFLKMVEMAEVICK